MYRMFTDAINFNEPNGKWNVSNTRDMVEMFSGASDFNQVLTAWVLNPSVKTDGMFDGNTLISYPPIHSRGVAFEVHDVFKDISISSLISVIGERNREGNLVIQQYISMPFSFDTYIKQIITSLIEEVEEGEYKNNLISRYDALNTRLTNIHTSVSQDNINLAYTVLLYVLRQPKIFKQMYIKEFLQQCTEAYGDFDIEAPELNISCRAGVFERIILMLGPAARQYSITLGNEYDDSYNSLMNALSNQLSNEKLNTWASICATEKEAELDDTGVEKVQEHIGIYRDCIREKLIGANIIKDNYGNNHPEFKTYMQKSIIPLVKSNNGVREGGRRTCKNKSKNKSKRRSRHQMTNKNKKRVRTSSRNVNCNHKLLRKTIKRKR
jgi:hypothetical protein